MMTVGLIAGTARYEYEVRCTSRPYDGFPDNAERRITSITPRPVPQAGGSLLNNSQLNTYQCCRKIWKRGEVVCKRTSRPRLSLESRISVLDAYRYSKR